MVGREHPFTVDNPRAAWATGDDRRMLRLDPAHPPLWRTPTTLQFGADPVAIVIGVEPWQEMLVDRLGDGIPDAALAGVAASVGADPEAAARFVQRIRRALVDSLPHARPRILVSPHDESAPAVVDAIIATLEDAGFDTACSERSSLRDATVPVILLAHRLVEPHRAARLLSDDIPHLAVVFTGDGAEVGPYVEPGLSACLACIAAQRRTRDPAWPVLATQLLGLAPPPVSVALAVEAAGAAAALIAGASHRRPTSSTSVTLRARSLHRTRRAHHPDEGCGCRSLGRIAMPPDAADPTPMSPRAYAQRA